MPIYEYTCDHCKKTFDQLVRTMSSDASKPKCPHCGSARTARALSVFAAHSGASGGSVASSQGGGCCPCGKNNGPCSMG